MADFTTALKHAQSYAAHGYTRNTRQAYASDWHLFTAWCAEQQRRPLPATAETILGYIGALADTLSVATIDRRLCGIAFYHRQARQPDPTDDAEVAVVLRGLRRKNGTAPSVKAPITLTLLRQLVAACGNTYRGKQERAVLLLGFAGAFRRSELVALTVEDLTFVEEGLVVRVRRSKTDQEGAGMLKAIPKGTQAETCPVVAVQT
jgi:integrase